MRRGREGKSGKEAFGMTKQAPPVVKNRESCECALRHRSRSAGGVESARARGPSHERRACGGHSDSNDCFRMYSRLTLLSFRRRDRGSIHHENAANGNRPSSFNNLDLALLTIMRAIQYPKVLRPRSASNIRKNMHGRLAMESKERLTCRLVACESSSRA